MNRITRTMVLAGVVLGLSSCASTQEMEELRMMAQDAQQTAAALETRVEQAERDASEAMSLAEDAMSAAEGAQNCCDANREAMDRMFERLQKK